MVSSQFGDGAVTITLLSSTSVPVPVPVPEPGSLGLLAYGFAGLPGLARRRRAVASARSV
jgi:hypothetical protein